MKTRGHFFLLIFLTALFCGPQFARAENHFGGDDRWEKLMEFWGITPDHLQSILACMGPKPGGELPDPDDVSWFLMYASLPVEGEQLPPPVDPREELNNCLKSIEQKQTESLSCVCRKVVSYLPVINNVTAGIDGDYPKIAANLCVDFTGLPLNVKVTKYVMVCVLKAAEVIDGPNQTSLPAPPPPETPSSPRPPKKRNPIEGIEKGQRPKQAD